MSAISSNALRRSAADPSPIPARKGLPDLQRVGSRSLRWTVRTGHYYETPQDWRRKLRSRPTLTASVRIGDRANYVHGAGVVDFTTTRITEVGPNRVRIDGTTGRPRTSEARVAVAVREGYMGMGRIIYGGEGAYAKATLAADMARQQLHDRGGIAMRICASTISG